MSKKELVKINNISVFKDEVRPMSRLAEALMSAALTNTEDLMKLLDYDFEMDLFSHTRALFDLCQIVEGSVFDEN